MANREVRITEAENESVKAERDTALAQLAEAKEEAELANRLVRETTAPESWNLMFDELVRHKAELSTLRASIAADFVKREDVERFEAAVSALLWSSDNGRDMRPGTPEDEEHPDGFRSEWALIRAALAATATKPTAS